LVHSKLIPALIAAVVVAVVALPAGAQTASRRAAKTKASSRAARPWSPPGAWHSIYGDASVKVYMDSTQTRREPDGTYRVRLRWDYPSSQMIDTRHPYRTMVDRKLLDCTTQGIKPVSARTYDVHGKPVAGYDTPDSQLKDIDWAKRPSGSSAAKAYAAACGAIRK
jgi:hypothetical protein